MSELHTVVATAFRLMGSVPRKLGPSLEAGASFEDAANISLEELATFLDAAPADDVTRLLIHQRLAAWDAEAEPSWAEGTAHQSQGRRSAMYRRLQPGDKLADAFDRHFPPHIVTDPGFDISKPFVRWFDPAAQEELGFYWPRYKTLLGTNEGWPVGNVESLARATQQVVERLGDPLAPDTARHTARGLVVGYVQSGKTANFTGVVARAVDAGYRLIIVLTGMTTTLRRQTQRRIDKQLIGQELLQGAAAGEFEYEDAPDWERFITYGSSPSKLGSVDWRRLTSFAKDYRRLQAGIGALEFQLAKPTEPLNSAANLAATPVRLVVAMKHTTPLKALIADLKHVGNAGSDIAHLPALVIDDESDQASVNTKRPTKKELQDRTAINRAIVELLGLLPRGQYVGYTATPFANVFIDPNDELGIFPRDFIIGLDRPAGYMGAAAYHDFAPPPLGRPSNEKSFVRDVVGDDHAPVNLRKAMDCYLLTGALKLFRGAAGEDVNVRHHTMLVHTSHLNVEHVATRDLLTSLLDTGGYYDGGATSRLKKLLRDDFKPISEARQPDLAFPENFKSLLPFINDCYSRLYSGGQPVLIVNGAKEHEDDTPDFDRDSVWKIVVGGTKLSRGYTVEGLTVSYYRRPTRAADTLMQMGRWFGFREGYGDLMRLFIGREEPLTKKKKIDLYAAFGAICQDELDFRAELHRYALPDDGSLPIRPMDVPPRVLQRYPDVTPTAKNKMFNAELKSENFGGKPINPTLAPKDENDVEENRKITADLFQDSTFAEATLGAAGSFDALVTELRPGDLVGYLSKYQFSRPGLLMRQLGFLDGKLGDPEIDRWIAVWPLLSKPEHGTWPIAGSAETTIIKRYRFDSGRFNVYTGSDHVTAARLLAGLEEDESATEDTQRLSGPRTGAALFYAVQELDDSTTTHVGFALYPPKNRIVGKTVWGVVDVKQPDTPIVTARSQG